MLDRIHNIQNNEKINKLGVYAFYLAVLIETLIVIVDKSAVINPLEGRLFQITFLLCLVKVITTKYEWREYIVIFLFCLLGLLMDQLGNRNEVLRMFMFIAACKDIDMEKCLKAYFKIMCAGIFIIMLLSVTGIFGSVMELKEFKDEGFKSLYTFGMGHPNTFHIMIFVLVILGLYLYKDVLRWWCYPPFLLLDYVLYKMTGARTPTLLFAGGVVLFFLVKYLDNLRLWMDKRACQDAGTENKGIWYKLKSFNYAKGLLKIGSWTGFLACIGGIELSIYFASEAWKVYEFNWSRMHWEPDVARIVEFDRKLTGRICMLMNYDNRAGSIGTWKYFTVPGHEEFFDLGYVRIFYWYGMIPAIILLAVFAGLIGYLIASDKYTDVVFLMLIAVFTVVEAHFVSVYLGRCYPVFLLGMYWVDMVRILFAKGKEKQLVI